MSACFIRKVAAVSFFLMSGSLLFAQDIVRYTDRQKKGETEVNGKVISDSVVGLKFKKSGAKDTMDVPSVDIVTVFYNPSGTITSIDLKQALAKETKAHLSSTKKDEKLKFLEDAVQDITALLPQVGTDLRLKTNLNFRVAKLKAEIALFKPEAASDAIKSLENFRKDNSNSWMTFHAIKIQAEFLEKTGKVNEAIVAYSSLGKLAGVPPESRIDADFLAIKLMVRAGQISNADAKIKELDNLISPNDPRKGQVRAFKLESDYLQKRLGSFEKDAGEVFISAEDPSSRGKILNLLGEFHLSQGKSEEAFWDFLKVDTLFNQDVNEHARALYNLSNLFDQVRKDPIRARQYQEKLLDPVFDGNEYQKKVKATEAGKK